MLEWAFDRFDRRAANWLEDKPTPTIVHGFEGTALRFLMMGHRLGARTVLDSPSAHELASQLHIESGGDPELIRRTTEKVRSERAAADIILAPSDFVVDRLVEGGVQASRIVHIAYGADLPPRRVVRPRTTFTALFVGRVTAAKGVPDLLDAWARFNRRPAQLVVVGAPLPEAAPWTKHPAAEVSFRGHLSGPDLAQAYADADVFVFPTRGEGSARVVYEAMAAGLPVVTTRQAGSVVTDGFDGMVIEAGDREALLYALQQLFDNPAEAARMGGSARETIEQKYTWPEYRRKIAALYQDISSGQG
jgi:glycosyltransferase involved in cell wall biosynthesis